MFNNNNEKAVTTECLVDGIGFDDVRVLGEGVEGAGVFTSSIIIISKVIEIRSLIVDNFVVYMAIDIVLA